MAEKLTRAQARALGNIAGWGERGSPNSTAHPVYRALERRGLATFNSAMTGMGIGRWYLTDAGRATLADL